MPPAATTVQPSSSDWTANLQVIEFNENDALKPSAIVARCASLATNSPSTLTKNSVSGGAPPPENGDLSPTQLERPLLARILSRRLFPHLGAVVGEAGEDLVRRFSPRERLRALASSSDPGVDAAFEGFDTARVSTLRRDLTNHLRTGLKCRWLASHFLISGFWEG